MDNEPFFTFSIDGFGQDDIRILEHFAKDTFDAQTIYSFAERLKYAGKIRDYFSRQLSSPSEAFIEFVAENACASNAGTGKIREIIREILPQIINGIDGRKEDNAVTITLNDNLGQVTNHQLISFTFDGKTYK